MQNPDRTNLYCEAEIVDLEFPPLLLTCDEPARYAIQATQDLGVYFHYICEGCRERAHVDLRDLIDLTTLDGPN